MRKYIIGIAIASMAWFTACVKSLDIETEITGKVVEGSTLQPIAGVAVTITDGSQNYAASTTGQDGSFALRGLTFNALSKECYLYANGFSLNLPSKKITLPKDIIGNSKYNMDNVVLYDKKELDDYNRLPTFTYSGRTYKIAPQSPQKMEWSDANDYCNNLELFIYSDWRLPSLDELHQMTGIPGVRGSSYWSNTQFYYVEFNADGTYRDVYDNYFLRFVRPVRIVN